MSLNPSDPARVDLVATIASQAQKNSKCFSPRRVRFVTRPSTHLGEDPIALRYVKIKNGRLQMSRHVVLWVRPGRKNADNAALRRTFTHRAGRPMTIYLAAAGGPVTATGNCMVTPEGVAFCVVAGLTGREKFSFGENNQLLTLDCNRKGAAQNG